MNARNDGGPAFPVETYADGKGVQTSVVTGWATGMSLRDWFAAHALAGMLSNGFMPTSVHTAGGAKPGGLGVDGWDYPAAAYAMADKMLKARQP